MDIVRSNLTVFFEDPFWVGIYEYQDGDVYEVMKITFGAMPKDSTILSLIFSSHRLSWHREETEYSDLKRDNVNPKRKQRQAVREMQRHGAGTKSQQALSCQRELLQQASKKRARENKEARDACQYAQKLKKRKEKHRGH